MQAIKYAAMVSQFTPDLLAQAFATHLSAQGEPTAHADARRALEDHAGGALDLKVLRRPRIVLIAGEFLDTTTSSEVWLTQMGVEVDLVRYQAYRTPGGLVVTTSKIWPLDEAEDLVVRPEEREEVEETQRERRRSRSVVVRLVEAGLIQDGAPMRFAIVPSQLSGALRDDVENWLAEDPQRGRATWVNSNPRCLRWELDGSEHSASGLVVRIVEQATGQRINVTGPLWWEDEEGNRLFEILEEHTGEQVYASGEHERDWSDLHACWIGFHPAAGPATATWPRSSGARRSPSASTSPAARNARRPTGCCATTAGSPTTSSGTIQNATTTRADC
jgi:hypothetical protein